MTDHPDSLDLAERRVAQAAREAHEARLAAERAGRVSKVCLATAVTSLVCSGGAVAFVVIRDEPQMQRAGSLVVDELTVRKVELVNEQAETVGKLEGSRVGVELALYSVFLPGSDVYPRRSEAFVRADSIGGAGFRALSHDGQASVALEARHIGGHGAAATKSLEHARQERRHYRQQAEA